MRILILGGYGVFGGRLIELIADLGELEILVCGRRMDKAEVLCRSIKSAAKLIPMQLDRADIAATLASHKPDIVVDASGPFQDYGGDRYQVVKACIAQMVNYLDFADAADFVFGISQFDQAAKDAEIVALSGVSSFPVLTAAVLCELGKDIEVHSVTSGIAPSPYAGIGLNVMRAVVGYAGGSVKLVRDGRPHVAMGLTESMRYTIAPPGILPLRNIHFSLVDVPDLQLLPADNPSIKNIWMGAGPVPESLHRILNLMAMLRAALRLPSFAAMSPLFYRILNLMKFGEHRGGMFVEVSGKRSGALVSRSWHLLAEGDDGPYIPSMAIESVVRGWMDGRRPALGARAATAELELSDYDKLFANRTIYHAVREPANEATPIFEQILGSAFRELPDQLQKFHSSTENRSWTGEAEKIASRNIFGKLIAKIIGFPTRDGRSSVEVQVSTDGKGELWQRRFGDVRFQSYLQPGSDKNEHLMTERFGVAKFAMALVFKGGKLWFIPRNWTFFGLPMPRFLMPGGDSFEYQKDGKF